MSKRPPNHPDRFAPNTPEWMRNSVLSTRLVNVLVAGHYGNENILRGMLTTQTGRQLLFKLPNMGKKGMAELRDWARSEPTPVVSDHATAPCDEPLLKEFENKFGHGNMLAPSEQRELIRMARNGINSLKAIRKAPGGGPGRRIAAQALDRE